MMEFDLIAVHRKIIPAALNAAPSCKLTSKNRYTYSHPNTVSPFHTHHVYTYILHTLSHYPLHLNLIKSISSHTPCTKTSATKRSLPTQSLRFIINFYGRRNGFNETSYTRALVRRIRVSSYDSITVSSTWELTSVFLRCSRGDGVNNSLSRITYCTHVVYLLLLLVYLCSFPVCVWVSSLARSCAIKDANNEDGAWKPPIPAGISCPPLSKTISPITWFGIISTR